MQNKLSNTQPYQYLRNNHTYSSPGFSTYANLGNITVSGEHTINISKGGDRVRCLEIEDNSHLIIKGTGNSNDFLHFDILYDNNTATVTLDNGSVSNNNGAGIIKTLNIKGRSYLMPSNTALSIFNSSIVELTNDSELIVQNLSSNKISLLKIDQELRVTGNAKIITNNNGIDAKYASLILNNGNLEIDGSFSLSNQSHLKFLSTKGKSKLKLSDELKVSNIILEKNSEFELQGSLSEAAGSFNSKISPDSKLILNNGALTLSGSGSFVVSETLSITGNSSLNIGRNITTQTLNLTDKSSFTSGGTGLLEIGTIKGNGTNTLVANNSVKAKNVELNGGALTLSGSGSFAISETLSIKGNSSLNIGRNITTQTLNLTDKSSFTSGGTGLLEIGTIKGNGTNTLVANNSVKAKNLDLNAGTLNLLGTGSFAISETLSIKGNSSLNIGRNITTQTLNLTDKSSFTSGGTGVLEVGTIKGNGINTLVTNNSVKAKNVELNGGALTLSGSGSFAISETLSIKGNSSLNIGRNITTQTLNLTDKSSFTSGGAGVLEVGTIKGNGTNTLVANNSVKAKNLELNGGALTLSGSGSFVVSETLSITGNSSLNIVRNITTQTLNLTDKSSFTSGGAGLLEVTNIKSNGTNSFVVNNSFKAKNLELNAGTLNLLGTRVLEVGTIKGNGINTLVANNSVKAKNLDLNAGTLTLSGSGSFAISETLSITGNSSLNTTKGITTQTLFLSNRSSFTSGGTGALEIETIKGNGTNTLVANNSVKAKNLELNAGTLNLSGSGSLNVANGIKLLGKSKLNLTNANTNMLASSKINNTSGVVNIGENKFNIANYEGGKGSELNLDINSSTNYGQLNVTNDFKITDGSFRIGVKYGLISDKGQQFNIVNANNINLSGNILYISEDTQYSLKPILGDNGKTLNVELIKANLIEDPVDPNKPVKPKDDITNILTGLQNIIDNGNGNQAFDKDLAIFIADRDNKNYNALQLKPISNTTKKEMNSIVARGFNSMVTDRILSVSDTEEGYKTKMVNKRFRNKRTGKIVVKQVPVEVFSSSEGLNVWTMAGGNKASLKGSNLHGIDGNSSKDSQLLDTIQVIAGLDYIGSNIVLGVAGGFGVLTSKNQESVERHLSTGNSFNGTLYGKFTDDVYIKDNFYNYYVAGSLGFTAISSENSRFIDMPLVPKENKATTTDSVIYGYGELGLNLNFDVTEFLVINPFVSVSYGNYTLSAYKEQGNGFALKMNEKTYSDIKAGLGLRIVANLGDLQIPNLEDFKPMIEVSYEQKLNKDEIKSEMYYMNATGVITKITDDSYSQNKLKIKVGLDYNYSDEIVIGVKGYQESNKEIINIGASIKVSYKL